VDVNSALSGLLATPTSGGTSTITESTPLPAGSARANGNVVVPITRRTDTYTTGIDINHRTIPGRNTITVATFEARHRDGSPDRREKVGPFR